MSKRLYGTCVLAVALLLGSGGRAHAKCTYPVAVGDLARGAPLFVVDGTLLPTWSFESDPASSNALSELDPDAIHSIHIRCWRSAVSGVQVNLAVVLTKSYVASIGGAVDEEAIEMVIDRAGPEIQAVVDRLAR